MNPYYYHYHTNLQQQQPYYAYRFPIPPVYDQFMIPVNYFTRTTYPPYMAYVDGVAILNTPINTTSLNQQPMHSYYTPINPYVPYHSRPEAASFLDTSHYSWVHSFDAFLEESLIMDELEADPELQQRLNTSTSGGSGLSEERISERLHVYTAAQRKMNENGEEVNDSCCICLCDYEKEEKMGILECGHQYHAECIKRWLLSKNVCPMCRSTALTL